MDGLEHRRVRTAINGWFLVVAATAALWVGVSSHDTDRLEPLPRNDGSYALGCRGGEIVFTPGVRRHSLPGESLEWPMCQEMWSHRQGLASRPHWLVITAGTGSAMVGWSRWRRGREELAQPVSFAA